MSSWALARAGVSDAAGILALRRAVLAEERWFITRPDELRGGIDGEIRRLRELSRAEHSLCMVAREEGRVVGLLVCTGGPLYRMRHTSKLEVMVAEDRRGRGLGKALVQAALDWLDAHPLVEKLGLSVFDDNPRAIALYESLGFEVEGRRPREYKLEDGSYRGDVLMYRFRKGL
ncbi:MAG: GNAT family N-acetyltransferase [Deltaproteobacteria bacterium]|nr:MAG: GNAT family N-acetyltransferase [Deltaproteobacteria bacterium]